MKKHTFIEYKAGKFQVIKKFLHFTGRTTKEMPEDMLDCLSETHTLTVLTKEGDARMLAMSFARNQGLSPIESYQCSNNENIQYRDVPHICTVSDMDKTNEGIYALTNYLFAFVYPIKYREYNIHRVDYAITYKHKYFKEVDYSIKEGRDEIIFSSNDKIQVQAYLN